MSNYANKLMKNKKIFQKTIKTEGGRIRIYRRGKDEIEIRLEDDAGGFSIAIYDYELVQLMRELAKFHRQMLGRTRREHEKYYEEI